MASTDLQVEDALAEHQERRRIRSKTAGCLSCSPVGKATTENSRGNIITSYSTLLVDRVLCRIRDPWDA